MQRRPKVLLLIPHLGGGGAERVIELLARGLSLEKYEVHLGLITQAESGGASLPSRVQVHALGARRVRAATRPLLRLVRRVKPDLILSGIFHLNFLVLLLRPFFPAGTRVLVRQNSTASSALNFGGLPWYTRLLYRLLYQRAERVICQTQAMAADLARELGVDEDRLAVLPNPVDVEGVRGSIGHGALRQEDSAPLLLAVGRLSREKGFDLLLRAMAAVRGEYPGVSLVIAGTGAEDAALKADCHALGLDDMVRFAGYLAHPWRLFPQAALFVLPSRHEGLPNALLEAATAGLPIVAMPACEGLTELLRDQPGVWLAAEVTAEALATALLSALCKLQPGERFAHPFVDAFRFDRALQAYESLIDQTLAAKP
jgi:glycosyltransferase involved in cell wall biosynthesis